jgi:hypothetical protein
MNTRRIGRHGWWCAGLALLAGTGCWQNPRPTMQQLERGLVWVFPGVEGGPWSMQWACRSFRDAGADQAIEIFDWQRLGGTLANLTDYPGNRQRAAAVAERIAAYRTAHPGAPIDLVGYSGGGGVAVFVVEALPEDVRLRHVVLAQAALSPDYDLTRALRRIDGALVSFHSPYDWAILGAGTAVWGTMDRKHVESCGKVGFDAERAVPDATLRDRLVQRGWGREMLEVGHTGGHAPILTYEWNKRFVAPYLLVGPPAGGDADGRRIAGE